MAHVNAKISPEDKARKEAKDLRELGTRLNGQSHHFYQALIENIIDLKSRIEKLEAERKLAV